MNSVVRRATLATLCAVIGALAALPAAASAIPLDFKSFEVSRSTTQAGARPNLHIMFEFCTPPHHNGAICIAPPEERLKEFTIRTPGGLLGNVNAVPYCEYTTWLTLIPSTGGGLDACAPETVLGTSNGWVDLSSGPSRGLQRFTPAKIYNVRPIGSEPARFGAIVHPDNIQFEPAVWQPTHFEVRTGGDFGLNAVSPNVFKELSTSSGGSALNVKVRQIIVDLAGKVGGKNFLTNPTNCDVGPDQVVSIDAHSHDDPSRVISRSVPFVSTGCENVPFDPTIDVTRETDQAGAPSGYTVGVNFPDSEEDPIHQSHLKNVEVTLPEGTVLNPGAAANLDDCSETQFGLGNDNPAACPSASDIGDIKVYTPLLDGDRSTAAIDPLDGDAYFAEPTATEPWRIFLNIADAGLEIKLEGKVEIDEATGQIKTTFLGNPQTPFNRFELQLRGGDQAVLQNPVDCGSHTVDADFTPWARPGDPPVHDTFDFSTTGCSDPVPFSPQIPDASTNPTQAGAQTVSKLAIERPDGQQLIKKMAIKLPAGLVGRLTGNPLCPVADAQAGTCSEQSKVGSVKVDVGAGNAPIRVGGEVFLSKPLQPGDAAGLSIVVPAKTGPISLGNVVTTNRVMLRQSDGGIDVETGDLPKIFKGVGLPLRRIEVLVDRKGFFQNPTSCAAKTLVTDFTSHGNATAQASFTAAATGCDQLPFSPRLELSVSGETAKNGHPALRAIVTQAPGQSNISRAEVLLPQVLRPDVPVLNRAGKLCRPDQIAVNACPGPSNIGSAVVHTPLLPEPLSGPVYIVQDPTGKNPLPRLVVQLRGLVGIDLNAANLIRGVRTLNVFENIPDVPQTRFELNIVGGREGILKNFVDLCETTDTSDATFFGHSGAVYKESPKLKVNGCKGGVKFRAVSARASKKGVVPVKLQCLPSGSDCNGSLSLASAGSSARGSRNFGKKSFSILAGDTKTVRVKLNRSARRTLERRKKLRLQATAAIKDGVQALSAKTSLTVRPAKKRRSRK